MAAKANQFSALSVKNVENRHVEEEMAFEKAIAEAVLAAVNTEATKKFEMRSNTKFAKAKNTTATHEGAITGELITLPSQLQWPLVPSESCWSCDMIYRQWNVCENRWKHCGHSHRCNPRTLNLIGYSSTAARTTCECIGLPRLHMKLKQRHR